MKKFIALILMMVSLQPNQFLFCGEADPALNPQAVPVVAPNAPEKPSNLPPADSVAQAVAFQRANFEGGALSSTIHPSIAAKSFRDELQGKLGSSYQVGYRPDPASLHRSYKFEIKPFGSGAIGNVSSISFSAEFAPNGLGQTEAYIDSRSLYVTYNAYNPSYKPSVSPTVMTPPQYFFLSGKHNGR